MLRENTGYLKYEVSHSISGLEDMGIFFSYETKRGKCDIKVRINAT